MTASLFHVPISGAIESLTPARVHQLAATETPETMSHFHSQMKRLADAGIDVSAAQPAVAGGLIVKCEAGKVARVYDSVFGEGAVLKTAKVIPFPKARENAGVLRDAFRDVAPRYTLGRVFTSAVGAPANDHGFMPSSQPSLRVA